MSPDVGHPGHGPTIQAALAECQPVDQYRPVEIEGAVVPGFEPVRDAFERNFVEHGDVGGCVAVYVEGELVVDLWGGVAEPATSRPWTENTIATVFSVTKGVAAILCALLHERGLLDLDEPVSSYWPAFAQSGKESVTLRHLLSHTAGLPVVDASLTMQDVIDGRKVVDALAAQRPLWGPGTKHGYHAITFGWLVGEAVRRATGRTLGEQFAGEVAAPLSVDFVIGLPDAEQHRVAALIDAPTRDREAVIASTEDPGVKERFRKVVDRLNDPTSYMCRSHTMNGAFPGLAASFWNRRDVRAIELCSVNGIGNARALARLFAAVIGEVDGIRLVSEAAMADITREIASGLDEVLPNDNRFASGLQLPAPPQCFYSPTSFGHYGAAGAVGFADPAHGIAFGYVPNRFGGSPAGDPRSDNLIEALRESLATFKPGDPCRPT